MQGREGLLTKEKDVAVAAAAIVVAAAAAVAVAVAAVEGVAQHLENLWRSPTGWAIGIATAATRTTLQKGLSASNAVQKDLTLTKRRARGHAVAHVGGARAQSQSQNHDHDRDKGC